MQHPMRIEVHMQSVYERSVANNLHSTQLEGKRTNPDDLQQVLLLVAELQLQEE